MYVLAIRRDADVRVEHGGRFGALLQVLRRTRAR